MIINTKLSNDDKEELEYMMTFGYMMPYGYKSKTTREKIIYIFTPILFLSGICCYKFGNHFMFYISMFTCLISVIWILFNVFIIKKFDTRAHDFVWNNCVYNTVEFNGYEVKLNDKTIFVLSDIENVIVFKKFFFFKALGKLFVVKTNDLEKEELIKLLQESNIEIEKKEKYFNIYKYFKEK